jgi:hypothetical protein
MMKGVLTAMKKNDKKTATKLLRCHTLLRFSPTAWAKLLFLRDAGQTEIGGFGIAPVDDLLFVENVRLVRQSCTWISAELDDESVADFFDEAVDAGRQPEQFFRLFMHTHPGDSPQPSATDEETFARVFGGCDWAVMFILARGGQRYARMRYNVGPGIEVELPVEVDYGRPFAATERENWHEEYLSNIHVPPPDVPKAVKTDEESAQLATAEDRLDDSWRDVWADYTEFDRYREDDQNGYSYE